jgi:hypothetical protein
MRRPSRALLLGAALLSACNAFREMSEDAETPRATRAQPGEPARAKATPAEPRRDPAKAPPVAAKGGGRPTVLFIVMDTVRAQNLSLCGYERPTSPVLESLRDAGAAWTCDAYSPGDWTVPSHASFFTGKSVPEHGSDTMGFKFSDQLPTLSERMKAQGYQAAMLTANPTLSEQSGLQRGFDLVHSATNLVDVRGEQVSRSVRTLLDGVDPEQPLFFFLNLIDAHDPYPRIPPNVGWVPPRNELGFDVYDPSADRTYHRFIRGELPPEENERFLAAVRDGYDYGIHLADRNVGHTLDILRREGWLENGYRLVITSDHGEFLGEHTLLRHGCFTWEPLVRVPFLYYDSLATEQITLPAPFAGVNAFWLVSEGRLPDTPITPTSFSKRRSRDVKVGADMAAMWLPDREKLVWQTDAFYRFDLEEDPNEEARRPLPANHPQRAELERIAAAHAAHLASVRAGETDPELVKALELIGYVE